MAALSRSNKQIIAEREESRTKHSKKIVDEGERLRMRADLEEIMRQEEESNNHLEALRLQKSPKVGPYQKGKVTTTEIPSLTLPQALEDIAEEKKKTNNKLKNKKKQAKDAHRKKKLEAEIEKSNKLSSSLSTSHLEQNFNHATFHDKVEVDNQSVEESDETGEVDEVQAHHHEHGDDEDFVFITNSLECMLVDGSPSSVVEEPSSLPALELGAAELSRSAKKDLKRSKKEKFKPEQDNNKLSKKQAKEASKARYAAFEARVLPGLVELNPLTKMKDHRAQAAQLWLKSPENPDHPNHALFLAHSRVDCAK